MTLFIFRATVIAVINKIQLLNEYQCLSMFYTFTHIQSETIFQHQTAIQASLHDICHSSFININMKYVTIEKIPYENGLLSICNKICIKKYS